MTLVRIIAPLPAPSWGGLHSLLETISQHLLRDGYDLVPVVPPNATDVCERFGVAGMDCEILELSRIRRSLDPRLNFKFAMGLLVDRASLASIADRRGASIFQLAGLQHIQGALAARKAHCGLVWQIHSDMLPSIIRHVLTPFARSVSDVIMVNGHGVRQAFQGLKKFPADRLIEFSAPISLDKFTFNACNRASARALMKVDESTVVIGTIGNQTYQKAHERLVDVLHQLQPRFNVKVVVLGGGELKVILNITRERSFPEPMSID